MFGASGRDKYKWWWKPSDSESRIRYFDWLIERYSDPVVVDYYPVI